MRKIKLPKRLEPEQSQFERLSDLNARLPGGPLASAPRGVLDAWLPGGSKWTGALQQKPAEEEEADEA